MKKFSGLLIAAALCAVTVNAQTAPSPRPRVERNIETRIIGPEAESQSFIGVGLLDVNKDNFGQFGLGDVRGVAVDSVVDGSPASKAGIQKGDVIVRFDGENVTSARKLQRLVAETAPDHKAKVSVLRGGKETDVEVTIGKREPAMQSGAFRIEGMPNIQVMPQGEGDFNLRIPRIQVPGMNGGNIERDVIIRQGGRQIGVGVAQLGKQLADYFGAADGKGLLVNEVREASPAAKVGLRAGDVIVAADGKTVAETEDLIDAINAKKEGEVSLTVIRNKKQMTVKVTPEAAKDGDGIKRIETITLDGPIGGQPLVIPMTSNGKRNFAFRSEKNIL